MRDYQGIREVSLQQAATVLMGFAFDEGATADDPTLVARHGRVATRSLPSLRLASWINYNHLQELTSERLARSIDIEQEEARTAFLFISHALDDASPARSVDLDL
jgi:hypothetical protein